MTGDGAREPSFDPRTWAREPSTGANAAASGPARTRRGAGLWTGGVLTGLVVAAVAAGLALRAPSPTRGTDPQPAAEAVPVIHQRLQLSDPAELAEALRRAGLSADQAEAAATVARSRLSSGEIRLALTLTASEPPSLLRLEARDLSGALVLVRPTAAGEFSAEAAALALRREVKVVRGEMDATSFYSSAVAAGVTDAVIPEFAAAFAFDFDFQREIRPGDVFEAAVERQLDADGRVAGPERLVYASLQTAQKSLALYRFRPEGAAASAWFDGNGVSVARALMRTPVEGARISSSFGPRTHPVLGYTRMHQGVDFAAPIGTAVYASGAGVVEFAGTHGGHGEYVRIRHDGGLATAYAHLSKFDPSVAVGAKVRQGQVIAMSGNSGLSSGPHLHYEVLVDGRHVDPLGFETAAGETLQGAALAVFRKERDRIDAARAAQNR